MNATPTYAWLFPASLWLSAILLMVFFAATLRAFILGSTRVAALQHRVFLVLLLILLCSAIGLSHYLLPRATDNTLLGFNLSFIVALATCSWLILLIMLIGSFWEKLLQIGVLAYPTAAIFFILTIFNDQQRIVSPQDIWPLEAHIWFSLIAYGLLTVSAVQAVFVALKQRSLKAHQNHQFVTSLPALTDLERTLFHLAMLSYATLTIALVTGFLFLENIFAQRLAHKTILTMLAWLLLSIFLYGHMVRGWRGIVAARWILAAFILVVIGFAGSRFVYDHLLS